MFLHEQIHLCIYPNLNVQADRLNESCKLLTMFFDVRGIFCLAL